MMLAGQQLKRWQFYQLLQASASCNDWVPRPDLLLLLLG
jgi:hypothetical protein